MRAVWHGLMHDGKLYELLLRIDVELWERARSEGCRHCGGPLHAAHYPRKPRGGPEQLPEGYDRRLSLCCAHEGCRRRSTPPSVRFLGRRVYLGAVMALVSVLQNGPKARPVGQLRELLGVSRRTIRRWCRWWTKDFVQTRLWRAERGRVMPAVREESLPGSLLERFVGEPLEQLVAMLRWLSPLTLSEPERSG